MPKSVKNEQIWLVRDGLYLSYLGEKAILISFKVDFTLSRRLQNIAMKELVSGNHLMLFAQTVQELSLARGLETVMRIVRTAARRLTGADGASFILNDGEHCYYADEDAISPLWKGQRFPKHTCVSGWVMEHGRPAVISDIYADERVPFEAYRPTFVKSLAVVPIRTIAPIGAIGIYWAKLYSPSDAEVQLLQSLADITSVTLENVRVYEELENRVRDRTVELEAKNRNLEALSYSLSHDLKAPLRFINLYTAELKEKYLLRGSNEGTVLADKVLKRVGTMNDLIGALLLFFAVGEEKLTTVSVSMQSIVTDVCNDLKEDFKLPVEFILHRLPNVEGDKYLLKQVWINLISNAIKYSSKKGKPVIEIGCMDAEDGTVFYVKDNGVGFDKKDGEKLFKVFERLHSHHEFEGSGLGLAIVERVISKHGGRVWADGEPNEGATFYFHLPAPHIAKSAGRSLAGLLS
jgi:signal transduction histidine kinase